MSVIKLIQSKMESMTRSERLVAVFVLAHVKDITFATLEELASQSDVSTTTVLRFCRRLNFDGFKEFQQAVRSDMKYNSTFLSKFQRTADNRLKEELMEQTISQGIHCIHKTFHEMPYEMLEDAIKLIANARRVYTFGMRDSKVLAGYAHSRLTTVRGDVFLYQDGFPNNVETILNLTEEDVFVAFLFHRYTKPALQILEILRKRNVGVVLITSPPVERVAQLATVLLPCYVDTDNIKNSAMPPICLVDYLCNAVAMVKPEDSVQRLKQLEELYVSSEIIEN